MGPLWPPLSASQRPPFRSGLPRGWSRPPRVSCRLRRVASDLWRPGPRGIRLISPSLSAAVLRPAEVVRVSDTSARLPRGLRSRPSGGVRRLSPTSRAPAVTALRAPGLGLASP